MSRLKTSHSRDPNIFGRKSVHEAKHKHLSRVSGDRLSVQAQQLESSEPQSDQWQKLTWTQIFKPSQTRTVKQNTRKAYIRQISIRIDHSSTDPQIEGGLADAVWASSAAAWAPGPGPREQAKESGRINYPKPQTLNPSL